MNDMRSISGTTRLVIAALLGTSSLVLANAGSATDTEADRHFQKANELRKVADHDGAIAEYEKAMSLSPNSKLAQDAQYWIGQSHLAAGRLEASLAAFQTLLVEHPASAIAPSTKQMIEQVQQAKQDYSLFEAVEKGDVEQFKVLISRGADVDLKNQEGRPLLHVAAEKGHAEIVNLLIENHVEVNARFEAHGTTPLHVAALEGHANIVKLLIDVGMWGAHLDAHARWGHTPLEYAALRGHKDVVELLLDKGADIEAADDWHNTALLVSTANNHPETVKLLLDRGANVEARVKPQLETPLHVAAREGYLEAARLLLRAGAYIDSRDMSDLTPLHHAVKQGHQDMVELLVDHGAMPWRRFMGQDLVGFAMGQNQVEMVKFLISKGCRHSPVHVAAFLGDIDEVKSYLAGGGDINVYDSTWLTLLCCATEGVQTEVVDFLINKGADVNQKCSSYGYTALHVASQRGNTEITRLLLDNGADVTIRGVVHGDTALSSATNKEILEILIARGADVNIKFNRRAPWPPDHKFDEDWTPLHNACFRSNPSWRKDLQAHQAIVELLVTHGADVNAKTKNGRTPMSLLKFSTNYSHNDKLIELLRKHGAEE